MPLPKNIFTRFLFTYFPAFLLLTFIILNSKFLIPKVSAADWIWGSDGNGNFVIKDRTTGVVKFQLDPNGAVTTSRLSAANLSSGAFGANTGGGNYSFPSRVGIGTTNPGYNLDVNGNGNFSNGLNVSSGFVGLGTINPGAELDILSSSGFRSRLNTGSGDNWFPYTNNAIYMRSSPVYITNTIQAENGNWLIPNSGSAYFNQGNVGIGTTGPTNPLSIVSATAPNNDILIAKNTSAAGYSQISAFNDVGTKTYMGIGGSSTGYSGIGYIGTTAGKMQLASNGGGGLLTLDSGGNVGIGTTAPAAKLDVAGTTSTISNAAGNIFVAPASGTLQVTGKTKESGVKAWYVGFTNGPAFGAGAWNNVGPSLAFTSDGGPLLISWDFSANGGSHVTCQVAVDGVWPGTAAGYPETGSPYWHEGLSYVNAGWQRISKSKVYRGIAAGSHTAQGQCATDGGTLGVCNAGSVGCSISVIQLQGT